MIRGLSRQLRSQSRTTFGGASIRRVDGPTATSTPSIPGMTLLSACELLTSACGHRRAHGKGGSLPVRDYDVDPLRQRDGRVVAVRVDVEGTRRRVARVAVRGPTGRRVRNLRHERTRRLVLGVGNGHREIRQSGRNPAHVGAIDLHRRGEGTGVGQGLGNPRARLNVGVERDGDGCQDADDRDNDHQLDKGEASLVRYREPLLRPPPNHWDPPCFFHCVNRHSILVTRPNAASMPPANRGRNAYLSSIYAPEFPEPPTFA